jgi:hypothetical protein
MFGDPKSPYALVVHGEERTRLLRLLPLLTKHALALFVAAVFASDEWQDVRRAVELQKPVCRETLWMN